MKCWICKKPADTREHVIKQSDIRRLFGRGPYPKGKRLKKIDQNQCKKLIQSEDSIYIKYQKSLCKECNSSLSQSWDEAYDKFMEYCISHESELKMNRKIDFKSIAVHDTGTFSKSLYSYFIKSFGCQLQEGGQIPPIELSEFLLEKRNNTNLKITFAIYENMPQKLTLSMIQIHDLEGDYDNLLKMPLNFTWAVSIAWLKIIFWFNNVPAISLGSPFVGNTCELDIGSYKEMR